MPRDGNSRDEMAQSPVTRPHGSTAERATLAVDRQPIPAFDAGSLSWVLPEIDQALRRGIESLATFRTSSKDATALKDARRHIHQAVGAVQMVGLDAVREFTDEIERQLARLDQFAPDEIEAAGAVIERACRKLSLFLAELANGAPLAALKLYPEYEAMQRVRGVEEVTPTDLFYPDLSPRAPAIGPRETIAADQLPSYLAKKRRLYQTGLLSWLRGDDRGARAMREAIAGIENVTTHETLRSFWWTVRALFEALTQRGLESGHGVKQLVGRIDLQIRRAAEGSAKAADRLRRDVLYYVAISAPVGPTVHAVQHAFGLSTLLPSAAATGADSLTLQPLLREARERLAGIKETWLNFAAGYAENPAALKQMLGVLHDKAVEIGHEALTKLIAALVAQVEGMPAGAIPDPLAMEFTTALLLAERALENDTSPSVAFGQQVDAMLERLASAGAGRTPPSDAASLLDELGKRAQERVLVAQVGHEIQANLRRMEELLDAFFRDHSKRAGLEAAVRESGQIRGALRMLGLDDADHLLALCEEQIQAYTSAETEVLEEELELLAESLCGLGLYIEAVEQQRPESNRWIAPLLAKRLGDAPPPIVEESESVEPAVASLRAELPRAVEAAPRDGGESAAQDELKGTLARLKEDAELIADLDRAMQAQAAGAVLERGGQSLTAAVTAIAESSAPAPEISWKTPRLLAVDASALDAGLLDSYLSEATAVLDAIAERHAALTCNSGDRDALCTVRRGFHTLNESSRRVGLAELSAIASEIEDIHSRLFEQDLPVTAAVLAMIDIAQARFREWVETLSRTGRVVPELGALHTALFHVEIELPSVASAGASAPAISQIKLPVAAVGERPGQAAAAGAESEVGLRADAATKSAGVAQTSAADPAARAHAGGLDANETTAAIRDDIDEQFLAVFLEEAAQLFSAAGKHFRAWRSSPRDETPAVELRRTLHTLKGSARTVGAMRLGELAHAMESRYFPDQQPAAATPELFAALEADLNPIAQVLDGLFARMHNAVRKSLGPQLSRESEPVVELGARAMAAPHGHPLAGPINAAAEAAVPRAPSNGKVPSLKANLLELASTVAWLRSQVREIEIQAQAQMQLRMAGPQDRPGGNDLHEIDQLACVQDLTHSLAEALNGVATVQQSLLGNLQDAESILAAQREPLLENRKAV